MRSLDSKFNEKDKNITSLNSKKEEQTRTLTTEYETKLNELNKYQRKGQKTINTRYKNQKAKLENDFYKEAPQALISDLEFDYSILEGRCDYANVNKEQINEAIEIKKTLKNVDKKSARYILKNLNKEIKELVQYSNLEDLTQPKEIFSYIFVENGKCHILTPIKEGSSNELTNKLENKIIDLLTKGKNIIREEKTLEIKEANFNYKSGFLTFEIKSNDSNDIAKGIYERLNNEMFNLEELKNCGIVHKARFLEHKIFEEFSKKRKVYERKSKLEEATKGEKQEISKKLDKSEIYSLLEEGKSYEEILEIDPNLNPKSLPRYKAHLTMDKKGIEKGRPKKSKLEETAKEKEIFKETKESLNLEENSEYQKLMEEYEEISKRLQEEKGLDYPITRTNLNYNARKFYDKMTDFEKETGKKVKFLPKKVSKKKD